MDSLRSTIERVASIRHSEIRGEFYRHASPGRDAFAGGFHGRWGANFPVIYLGRPVDSSIIEAYRHLVEDAGVPPEHVKRRVLYTVPVAVARVLDLTGDGAAAAVGLLEADLRSPVGEYAACQRVAAAAHQLKYHGILAPAAEGDGQTLALFRDRLTLSELPIASVETVWDQLPADPRRGGGRLVQFPRRVDN